jgi:hypothetical protein
MLVNALEGVVEGGRIRLRENIALAENARVWVIVTEAEAPDSPAAPAQLRSPRLADPRQAGDFRKQVVEPPADARL